LLRFVPAWTLGYWQPWLFLGVFGGSMLAITLYLMRNDPKLLARRMKLRAGTVQQKRPLAWMTT
jgi:hypothetical protein